MARTIAIINQKGGVGKTTTTVNLGAALAVAGCRVALLDLDPRADLTSYLSLTLATGTDSVYESLFGQGTPLTRLVQTTEVPGLFAAAASPDLVGAELLLQQMPPRERFGELVRAIRDLGSHYDFVLLDSPPGLQMLSVGALRASDEVIIPQQCSYLALHGYFR